MSCGDSSCSLTKLRVSDGVTQLRPQFLMPEEKSLLVYDRRGMYDGISDYFGDLTMTKIPSTNPTYSMYACRISCMCNEIRYVFVITLPDVFPIGTNTKLTRLKWISFQTRVSTDEYLKYGVKEQSYVPKKNLISSTAISQTNETESGVEYRVHHHPMKLQLIGTKYFSPHGTIGDALETFSTVLWFSDT